MAIKKDDIRNWVIYKITSPSGRVYIGKTSNYRIRLNQYRKGDNSRQRVLDNSFKKYGFEQHTFDIIDSFQSNLGYVNGKEMFWIRSYMSNVNKWPKFNGMNLTDGGEGQSGRPHTEETKAKIRAITIARGHKPPGVIWTDEMRKKMSEYYKGKPKTGRKRTWTDEQRKQMSEFKKKNPSPNSGRNYNHLSEEERKIKFGKHNLGNSYNKGRKKPKHVIEASVDARATPIYQYSLDGTFINYFRTLHEAHTKTGISEPTIIGSAKGQIKRPNKFIFKYNNILSYSRISFNRRVFNMVDIKEKIA